MDQKEKHIDEILLNKSYNELSAEEFLTIKKEEINSESEYNDLRTMLLAATKELSSAEEIEPQSETKAFLMKEFTRLHPATNSRSGGLGFLFPKERVFYQQPGYQLLAIAAVLVLVFTIYTKLGGEVTSSENVAQHNAEEPQPAMKDTGKLVSEETGAESKNKNIVIGDSETSVETTPTLSLDQSLKSETGKSDIDLLVKEKQEQEQDFAYTPVSGNSDGAVNKQGQQPAPPITTTDELSSTFSWDNTADKDDELLSDESTLSGNTNGDAKLEKNNLADNEGTSTIETDAYTDAGIYKASEIAMADVAESKEEISLEVMAENDQKDRAGKKMDAADLPAVKKVKSLAENAELIDLFYTAM